MAVRQVTILNGQSLSGPFGLGHHSLIAIHMPAAWDAADLTFQGGVTSDGPWQNVLDSTDLPAEVTVGADANIAVGMLAADLDALSAFQFLRIRSGTSGVAVNQTANRVITIVLK